MTGHRRVALLVVHGVGSQRRFSTLDKVVTGLLTAMRNEVERITHVIGDGTLYKINDGPLSGVRVNLTRPLARTGARQIDVFEAYWAPLPRGFATLRSVAIWMWRSMLTPLRRMGRTTLTGIPRGRRLEIAIRETIGAVLSGGMALAILLLAIPTLFGGSGSEGGPSIGTPTGWRIATAVAVALGLQFLLVAVRSLVVPPFRRSRRRLWRFWVRKVRQEPVAALEDRVVDDGELHEQNVMWGWFSSLSVVIIALLVFRWVPFPDLERAEWIAAAGAGAATILALGFVSYVGDVAVYVTEDSESLAGQARARILDSVAEQIRVFLQSDEYDVVHILGHSLGGQIAYDAINRLRREVEFVTDRQREERCNLLTMDEYDRLGSFITIACPMDRVAYFFRSTDGRRAPIQAEIVRRETGLRRRGTEPAPWQFEFDRDLQASIDPIKRYSEPSVGYRPRVPPNFAWLNIQASPDPIGTGLIRYRPDQNKVVRIPSLNAHRRVLVDRRTYDLVAGFL